MRLILALAFAALLTRSAPAQSATELPKPVGTLIVAHGASAEWNARVDSLAARVRRDHHTGGPVAVSYLMGATAQARAFQDAVAALERAGARSVVVVPLLVSSHSGHFEQIRYLAGETDSLDAEMKHHLDMAHITRANGSIPIRVAAALDNAPEVASVIVERARALTPSTVGHALFILGHGPNSAEDYAEWMRNLRPIAERARASAGFASVSVELVRDDAPPHVRAEAVARTREMIQLLQRATGHDVTVVPLLISSGEINQHKLPADLAGLPIVYDGKPLLPDPAMAAWVAHSVEETSAARSNREAVEMVAPAAVHTTH